MSIYDDYTPSGSSRTYRVLKRLQATSIASLSRVVIDGIDSALSALDVVIASKVAKPGGGLDGQALVKSGDDVVWGRSGGAVGGGSDAAFYVNDQAVTTSYAIPSGKNAVSVGPITVNAGITVTVPTGSVWAII